MVIDGVVPVLTNFVPQRCYGFSVVSLVILLALSLWSQRALAIPDVASLLSNLQKQGKERLHRHFSSYQRGESFPGSPDNSLA